MVRIVRRQSTWFAVTLLLSLACSESATPSDATGGTSASTGGTGASGAGGTGNVGAGAAGASGGTAAGSTGGASGGESGGAGGTSAGNGGKSSSGGNAGSTPVDCAPITTAGFELCETGADFCGAVFTDGSGCTAVCQAAGLECEQAFENQDDSCGANETLPALDCDSGHLSDYCLCRGSSGGAGGSGGAGAGGGSAGSGGNAGSGGSGGSSSAPDCNSVSNQPIIEVAADGSGDYATVQAALNSLSKSNTTPTQIRIAPGTYSEKLAVGVPHVTLCGQAGKASETILTYGDNAMTPNGNGGTLGTSGSASTNISASNVSAENLTFRNSTPLGGSQAVALLVTGNQVQFRNARFLSYQDTLYVKSGTQYFKDCYVAGSVDFIFGGATAVFEDCTVHSAAGGVAVTAPSTDQAVAHGLVFLGGELTAASSISGGSVALGRNWYAYGATTFLGTALGAHISAVGWIPMGSNTLDTARFSEYQTSGPGAKPAERAPQSSQLSSSEADAYTVENLFGSWTPTFSP